ELSAETCLAVLQACDSCWCDHNSLLTKVLAFVNENFNKEFSPFLPRCAAVASALARIGIKDEKLEAKLHDALDFFFDVGSKRIENNSDGNAKEDYEAKRTSSRNTETTTTTT
ncbi:unnamed protein product, partial [Amoebophrya sp. A25]